MHTANECIYYHGNTPLPRVRSAEAICKRPPSSASFHPVLTLLFFCTSPLSQSTSLAGGAAAVQELGTLWYPG